MFCPKCTTEYNGGISICSDCRVPLVEKLPEQQIDPDQDDDFDFVPLLTTYNLEDIAFIRGILDGTDVTYYLQGENTAFIRTFMDPVILQVKKDDVPTVKELLKDLDVKYLAFSKKDSEE